MAAVHDPCRELNTTYCGVLAQQWWTDYLVWEKVLNAHPELEAIVELGTGAGGFALYLHHQAEARQLRFSSYDKDARQAIAYKPWFHQADVFDDAVARAQISLWLSTWATVLHCDGGNKRREVREYATRLLPGSLAIVHDYGTEFTDADIPEGLAVAHRDITEAHGGLSRILVKT